MLRVMLTDDLMQLVRDVLLKACTPPFYAVVFWAGRLAVRGRCAVGLRVALP